MTLQGTSQVHREEARFLGRRGRAPDRANLGEDVGGDREHLGVALADFLLERVADRDAVAKPDAQPAVEPA